MDRKVSRGDKFTTTITVTDQDGTAIDLTGATLHILGLPNIHIQGEDLYSLQ